ncbi:MAG: T9SS type A sorting domain-containing protein [Lewinellaceae bacterium]|nr:T9SS type A sorting domain-containing protein [Lewinellaceae bacterium]
MTIILDPDGNGPNFEVVRLKARIPPVNNTNILTEFTLWADCNLNLEFFQLDYQNVIRNPSYNNQGASAANVKFYKSSDLSPVLTVLGPEILNGQLKVRIYFHTQMIVQKCSAFTGTCNCCPEYKIPPPPHLTQPSDRSITIAPPTLSIAPNPFTQQIQVDYTLEEDGHVAIQVANATGQVVKVWAPNELLPSGSHTQTIETNELPPGIYFLQFKSATGVQTRTLVKTE